MLTLVVLSVFPAAMAFAAAIDTLTMTIPNKISIALVFSFLSAALLSGFTADVIATHIAVGVAMLIAGIAMFALGWMGGGDAKLLAAASLWLGFPQFFPFLIATAVIGSVLMLAIVIYRSYPAAALPIPDWALRLHRAETGLPYGVAIGAAGLLVFPYTPLFQAFT